MLSRCLLFTLFLYINLLCPAEGEKKNLHCLDSHEQHEEKEVTISNDKTTKYCTFILTFYMHISPCHFKIKKVNDISYGPKPGLNNGGLGPLTKLQVDGVAMLGDRFRVNRESTDATYCAFNSEKDLAFHGFHQFKKLLQECSTMDEYYHPTTTSNVTFGPKCMTELIESGELVDDHKLGNVTTQVGQKVLLDDDDEEYKGKLMEFNEIETTTKGSNDVNRSLLTVAIVGLILIAIQ